jgi:hypothetical protein
LAQGLLELDLPAGRPLLMLSENDLDQALLTLAALHVGIPVSTISVAYSRNTGSGCSKLKAIVEVLKPALIFVNDGDAYCRAIELVNPDCPVVAARQRPGNSRGAGLAAVVQGRKPSGDASVCTARRRHPGALPDDLRFDRCAQGGGQHPPHALRQPEGRLPAELALP